MKFSIPVFARLLTSFFSQAAQAQPGGSRQDLEGMFANISQNTAWNMSKDMLWGYFFTNPTSEKLELVAKDLEQKGYRIVDIYLSDKENPSSPDLWWLHVERIETHSVDSLLKRNADLAQYAIAHHLGSYDGMDVGPVNGTNK
ncbi:ribonuclease E inhibitor RraB [Burkholderiaceae bacterium DAT-1]|nr:ribonuclease E inhibitor RraB [Burkholderiaceae bacterium DAT-1]